MILQLREELKHQIEWMESQKEGLIMETKLISAEGFDWTKFDFHYYNLLTTFGKIRMLKDLLKVRKETEKANNGN